MHKFSVYSITLITMGQPTCVAVSIPILDAKKALRAYAKKNSIRLLALAEENREYSAVACGLRIYPTGTQQKKIKTPILLEAKYFTSTPD